MQAIELKGVHFTIDEALERYVHKKLGKIDRYMTRHCAESAHMQIWLKENQNKDQRRSTCEVTLHLPHDTIHITETTLNMYAAVDIVQAKLKQQIKKHRELHEDVRQRRRLLTRFRRQTTLQSL